jgi:hypothetical protein
MRLLSKNCKLLFVPGTILEVPYENGMRDEVTIPYNPLATASLSAEEVKTKEPTEILNYLKLATF